VLGKAHTNTIKGYFSIFKYDMKGVYQHCGETHLHRYIAEYDFRYSNRRPWGLMMLSALHEQSGNQRVKGCCMNSLVNKGKPIK
jgi:hypothetical protein